MKVKEEKGSDFATVAQLSAEERAERTHKKHIWYLMTELNRAIYDAKKAGIKIGKVEELDLTPYFDDVRIKEAFQVVGIGGYMGR